MHLTQVEWEKLVTVGTWKKCPFSSLSLSLHLDNGLFSNAFIPLWTYFMSRLTYPRNILPDCLRLGPCHLLANPSTAPCAVHVGNRHRVVICFGLLFLCVSPRLSVFMFTSSLRPACVWSDCIGRNPGTGPVTMHLPSYYKILIHCDTMNLESIFNKRWLTAIQINLYSLINLGMVLISVMCHYSV